MSSDDREIVLFSTDPTQMGNEFQKDCVATSSNICFNCGNKTTQELDDQSCLAFLAFLYVQLIKPKSDRSILGHLRWAFS